MVQKLLIKEIYAVEYFLCTLYSFVTQNGLLKHWLTGSLAKCIGGTAKQNAGRMKSGVRGDTNHSSTKHRIFGKKGSKPWAAWQNVDKKYGLI